MSQIVRLTLFKLPDPAAVQDAIKIYSTLSSDALKDGKPYIKVATASATYDDPRNLGYTLVAHTAFTSKADMDYYDNECQAHGAIKTLLRPKVAGPPLIVYVDA